MRKWEEAVRKVVPYVPGEQPKEEGIIKLNTNENPYPPAPGVEKVLREFRIDQLRKYPDPAVEELVNALADNFGVSPKEVFTGVGSDDVLAMCFLTFFGSKDPILFPDITYSFYDVWADLFCIPYEQIPLKEDLTIDPKDYKRINGGIIFPNPNAPTGIEQPLAQVEEIIKANQDVIVIVDEAYIDFGGTSAVELIHKYDNLLIVQTFSKSRSMAGNRIGYAIANERLIAYLNDVKYSFNSYTMDRITIACAVAALEDHAYFEETVQKVIATRERVKAELKELGFTFGDSKSNFIFATHKEFSAKELFEALKEKKIYVRYFNKPRIDEYLRISIGTDAEMDVMIKFLREYMSK